MSACPWCGYTTGGHEPGCLSPSALQATTPEETRREAKRRIEPAAATLRALVLRVIDEAGGLTCDEVEVRTGLTHQCVSARINELAKTGALAAYGAPRKTRSGRNACVWIATWRAA